MSATRKHLAGLELALERWNAGGPAIQYGKLLSELIEQAQSAPEPVQGEAVEVVGFVTLGGLFHGGSGPELGDIDIEPDMGALERLQYRTVDGSDDVQLDLMTVAQHQRILAQRDAELEFETGRYIELCLEHKALKAQLEAERDKLRAELERNA